MKHVSKLSLVALSAAAVAAGGLAYAAQGTQGNMENDAMAITKAKTTLVQAIAAAEQAANGKAARAEFELSKQGWVYDVEVISGAKVFDVRIDADKGTVIASAEDKTDRDDDHDKVD